MCMRCGAPLSRPFVVEVTAAPSPRSWSVASPLPVTRLVGTGVSAAAKPWPTAQERTANCPRSRRQPLRSRPARRATNSASAGQRHLRRNRPGNRRAAPSLGARQVRVAGARDAAVNSERLLRTVGWGGHGGLRDLGGGLRWLRCDLGFVYRLRVAGRDDSSGSARVGHPDRAQRPQRARSPRLTGSGLRVPSPAPFR